MNPNELSEVQDLLINILPGAGRILRRFSYSIELKKKKKGKLDFVTAADLEVDRFLRQKLNDFYPDIPILSEEHLHKFKNIRDMDLLFVIDPLDGTGNFSKGDINYTISIALLSRSIPLLGVIFVPHTMLPIFHMT